MADEVDFMVKGYWKLNFFGSEVYITTTHVCTLILVLVILIFGLIVRRRMKRAEDVPERFQNIVEIYVELLDHMVAENMGKSWMKYADYMLTVFLFILLSNISGIFGLRPPTADYGCTLMLALITFALIQYNAFKHRGLIGYAKSLAEPVPILLPINIISEFAVPLSLSLRLFGNIMAGTVMMGLYYSLLPKLATLGIPVFLHAYLDVFAGAIQTYVFCLLSMVFIRDKLPE